MKGIVERMIISLLLFATSSAVAADYDDSLASEFRILIVFNSISFEKIRKRHLPTGFGCLRQ